MPTEKPARASGISAAEKYAELEARGEERPRCECHGERQNWTKNHRWVVGGYWTCAIKDRERSALYYASFKEEILDQKAHYRSQNPEKLRERNRTFNEKRRGDPDYRRWQSIYMIDYHHRRKNERWADQGLTLRNDGEEGSPRGDRTAA